MGTPGIARCFHEPGGCLHQSRNQRRSLRRELRTPLERRAMQNVLAIWQREMKAYFVSPIAYVVLTVFLFLSGFFFTSILSAVIQSTMMQGQFGQGSQPV